MSSGCPCQLSALSGAERFEVKKGLPACSFLHLDVLDSVNTCRLKCESNNVDGGSSEGVSSLSGTTGQT